MADDKNSKAQNFPQPDTVGVRPTQPDTVAARPTRPCAVAAKHCGAVAPQSVAIVRFSAIGDVAMSIPAVYNVCLAYPDKRFVVVTRRSMASMFVNHPANLTILGIDIKSEYKGIAGMKRLLDELRRDFGIDTLVDLQDNLTTKYLRMFARLHSIRTAHINNGHKGKHALTRRNNKVMLPLISSMERYRNAFNRASLPADERFKGLFGTSAAAPESYSVITDPKRQGEVWIGIAPYAKHPGKIYPPELMEQVVATLAGYPDTRIFLLGGVEERELLERWQNDYPGVRSLAGEHHGFGNELSLLSNMDCVVSMDSANMHLASLVGVPVVSIWGATHPYCGYKGWRQADDNIIQLPITCRPCSVFGDKPCHRGDHICLEAIKPSVISDKVLSIVGRTRPCIGRPTL